MFAVKHNNQDWVSDKGGLHDQGFISWYATFSYHLIKGEKDLNFFFHHRTLKAILMS